MAESPTKRKFPETVAATETEAKAPLPVCPTHVPFLAWRKVIREALFENEDGAPRDYDGLASNAHAIFAGLKRDMDSLTQYVTRNQGQRFSSDTHLNLFRQNVTNVRDKIKSILMALGGPSKTFDAVDAELAELLCEL